jgi:rhodanese-related sulfurtransferase
MDTLIPASNDAIFARAASRATAQNLSYAGAVMPEEAHQLWTLGVATIVDVRTKCEFEYVGHIPNTPLNEWKSSSGDLNANFIRELLQVAKHDDAILLLCRSGVRSHAAAEAATRAGFQRVYNILDGFEGTKDDNGQRGKINGWRFAGLPWQQG